MPARSTRPSARPRARVANSAPTPSSEGPVPYTRPRISRPPPRQDPELERLNRAVRRGTGFALLACVVALALAVFTLGSLD